MDYLKLIKDLTADMRKISQYKRIASPFRFFILVAMLPLLVTFAISRLVFWLTLFFQKMFESPASHLHAWLKGQKDEVNHATQAIMYLVCLPFIFTLQIILSFFTVSFYFQWFIIMIQAYILTLGGIKWQPFINEATFEDDGVEYTYRPQSTAVAVYSCVALASLLFPAIIFGASLALSFLWAPIGVIGSAVSIYIEAVYLITIFIATPLLFKRVPVYTEKIADAEAEAQEN